MLYITLRLRPGTCVWFVGILSWMQRATRNASWILTDCVGGVGWGWQSEGCTLDHITSLRHHFAYLDFRLFALALFRFFVSALEVGIMEIQKRSFKLTTTHQLAPVVLPYILLLIASIAVILRFWARRIRKAGYGVDDWLVLLAIVRWILERKMQALIGW